MKKFFTAIVLCLVCTVSFTSCDSYIYDYGNPRTSVSYNGVSITTIVGSPDFVGGCSLNYVIKNNSGKNIKYIEISTVFLDNYNTNIHCEITGRDWIDCKITGPIYNNSEQHTTCSLKFYNYSAKRAHITHCDVIFEDNTKINLVRK
jgi:hypothetical protein